MIADKLSNEGWRFGEVPMRGRDLVPGQTDEAIAAFQCMVHKCEFMFTRERCQPQRQFRQLDRTAVLVDPIETALCDETLRMKLFVLVAWYMGTRFRPARP